MKVHRDPLLQTCNTTTGILGKAQLTSQHRKRIRETYVRKHSDGKTPLTSAEICNQHSWRALFNLTYLEPVCPVFLSLNPPKKKARSNQNKGHLGSRCIYIYICENIHILPSLKSTTRNKMASFKTGWVTWGRNESSPTWHNSSQQKKILNKLCYPKPKKKHSVCVFGSLSSVFPPFS